jgi:hypothetical protein
MLKDTAEKTFPSDAYPIPIEKSSPIHLAILMKVFKLILI